MIIIIKLCVCVCAIEQWATTRRTMDSIYSVYHLPYNLYICLYARRLKHQHFFPLNWGFLMTRSNLIQFTQFNVMIINPRASIKMLRFLLIRWDTTKKKKKECNACVDRKPPQRWPSNKWENLIAPGHFGRGHIWCSYDMLESHAIACYRWPHEARVRVRVNRNERILSIRSTKCGPK